MLGSILNIKNKIFRILKKGEPYKVYAVSFPKSGRTWIELMVAKIYEELTGYNIEDILNNRNTNYIDKRTGKRLPHVFFSHGYQNIDICRGNYFPKEFYKNKKVFLLARDPRDVVVSHYYYMRWNKKVINCSLSDFVRFNFEDENIKKDYFFRFGIKHIMNYMNAWISEASIFKDFYVAYYEDFKENVYDQMKKLLSFIEINVPEEVLAEAIEFGSFDSMRALEQERKINWHGIKGSDDPRGAKVRKGRVGGYREELSKEDIDYMDEELQKDLHPYFKRYK